MEPPNRQSQTESFSNIGGNSVRLPREVDKPLSAVLSSKRRKSVTFCAIRPTEVRVQPEPNMDLDYFAYRTPLVEVVKKK